MSRIGKVPVTVPAGVTVEVSEGRISVKGPKGVMARELPPRVSVALEGGKVFVKRDDAEDRTARAMHGLARTLVRNMVRGVSAGFSKTLEIVGVGYRVEQKKEYLVFALGYSHPIYYELPTGLQAKLESPTRLHISGADPQVVGAAAATIRSFRPPEPYKGKGIKYADETIRRKEGKSGAR
jgi:large subunit ribosomal protein L6